MITSTLDDFLLRHSPAAPLPVAPALLRARDSLRAALADLGAIADSALEKPWPWRGAEMDVRYGFYRQYEALQNVRAEIRPLIAPALIGEAPARPIVAAATAARWDLHGLLSGLDNLDLDRDPGNGEWTLRQTLAHIVNGQRAYGWFTAWWLARRDSPAEDVPPRVPDDVAAELPAEETDGVGSLGDIGRRLDDILDLSAGALGGLDDDGLAAHARWSGLALNVRFRLVRWSSHIREHAIQVEKTLVFVGRPTSEADRLLRLICAAYGSLEEELYLLADDLAAVSGALARVEAVASGVAADAKTIRWAAG